MDKRRAASQNPTPPTHLVDHRPVSRNSPQRWTAPRRRRSRVRRNSDAAKPQASTGGVTPDAALDANAALRGKRIRMAKGKAGWL